MPLFTHPLSPASARSSLLLVLISACVMAPSVVVAQEGEPQVSDTAREISAASARVDQAAQRAGIEAWEALASVRRGQREILSGLSDADAARRLAAFSVVQAVQEGDYQTQRVVLARLPALEAPVVVEPEKDPLESSKNQAAKATHRAWVHHGAHEPP